MTREHVQDSNSSKGSALLAGKYLTFHLGEEEFGLQIMKVQEIIGLTSITKLPSMPVHIRGIINLRGRIIPIVDLRAKFEMPASPDTDKTCIIAMELGLPGAKIAVGLLVDQVSEVLDVSPEDAAEAPDIGQSRTMSFVLGVGIVKGGIKLLLDIDRALKAAETEITEPAGVMAS